MRIITSFEAIRGGGNSERLGVSLTQAQSGDHKHLSIKGKGVLARVSNSAFAEMVKCGDAVDEPITTLNDGKRSSLLGGSQVFRCDVEIRGNELWLVPESAKGNDVLLFLQWDDWTMDGSTIEPMEGVKLLASVEEKCWKNHWDAISLQPGASLKLVMYGKRKVTLPGPDWFNWFRKDQWERCVAWERHVSLSADGAELAL